MYTQVPILFLQPLLLEHTPISLSRSLSCHMHVPFLSTLLTDAADPLTHHYTPTELHGVTRQTVIFSVYAVRPSNQTEK